MIFFSLFSTFSTMLTERRIAVTADTRALRAHPPISALLQIVSAHALRRRHAWPILPISPRKVSPGMGPLSENIFPKF